MSFVLLGWMTQVLEPAIIGLAGIYLAWALGVVPFDVAFSGFSNNTPWFLYGALLFGGMAAKSGLARRLAFSVMRRVSNSPFGRTGTESSSSESNLLPGTVDIRRASAHVGTQDGAGFLFLHTTDTRRGQAFPGIVTDSLLLLIVNRQRKPGGANLRRGKTEGSATPRPRSTRAAAARGEGLDSRSPGRARGPGPFLRCRNRSWTSQSLDKGSRESRPRTRDHPLGSLPDCQLKAGPGLWVGCSHDGSTLY